jgi:hypothetical protein
MRKDKSKPTSHPAPSGESAPQRKKGDGRWPLWIVLAMWGVGAAAIVWIGWQFVTMLLRMM